MKNTDNHLRLFVYGTLKKGFWNFDRFCTGLSTLNPPLLGEGYTSCPLDFRPWKSRTAAYWHTAPPIRWPIPEHRTPSSCLKMP